jgi:hypothetical protein
LGQLVAHPLRILGHTPAQPQLGAISTAAAACRGYAPHKPTRSVLRGGGMAPLHHSRRFPPLRGGPQGHDSRPPPGLGAQCIGDAWGSCVCTTSLSHNKQQSLHSQQSLSQSERVSLAQGTQSVLCPRTPASVGGRPGLDGVLDCIHHTTHGISPLDRPKIFPACLAPAVGHTSNTLLWHTGFVLGRVPPLPWDLQAAIQQVTV